MQQAKAKAAANGRMEAKEQMDTTVVSQVLRDAMTVAIKLGAPMLLLAMLVGIVMAIFQAVTQIHEQSLAFILKMIVVIVVLLMGGSWMMETLQDYTREIFSFIAS